MISIKQILYPIDFSDFSRHALARAAALARAHGASVTAVHVVPVKPPVLLTYVDASVPAPLTLTAAERDGLLSELKEFTAPEAADGLLVLIDVVDAPTVHGEILAQAGRLDADLIVMGTHGRTGFERLLLGSVTEKVLRTARQPVLTVGADACPATGTSAFTRILCAVDLSGCSLAALRYAFALAEESDALVTAVNVVEWTPVGYDPLMGPLADLAGYRVAAETTARARLHEVVAACATKKTAAEEIVTSGKPHHEIVRIASERQSDLIALGIHGRNAVDRMLFGSTAEPVVRRATCPVLTVRAEVAARVAAA
jgi:nucleotide-binding universal stress UspA family protein